MTTTRIIVNHVDLVSIRTCRPRDPANPVQLVNSRSSQEESSVSRAQRDSTQKWAPQTVFPVRQAHGPAEVLEALRPASHVNQASTITKMEKEPVRSAPGALLQPRLGVSSVYLAWLASTKPLLVRHSASCVLPERSQIHREQPAANCAM